VLLRQLKKVFLLIQELKPLLAQVIDLCTGSRRNLNMAKTVSDDMIIRDVLKLDEGTAPIFMKHGMHCLFCPSASGESIRDACAVHGIDPNLLISDLNQYLSSKE
jgi:hybrid cluster-associated redox disulfide protein